jgi:hypothetical protein
MRKLVLASILSCLFAGAASPALAQDAPIMLRNSRHALVIGIGHYISKDIPQLDGVQFDMESARKMAHAMSIPDSNITFIRDTDATADRIREELAALDKRTSPGDRIFVYYSGHGTRWYDASADKQTCTEGLLAADGQVLTNQELGDQLKKIADKTDKLMVFYDACFSGGVASAPFTTRSIKLGTQRITPKFTSVGAPEMCAKPSNFRTRSLSLVMHEHGGTPENVVHIAASRPDEVSFDNPLGGGFATTSWRDCLLGAAQDLDGSGAITVDEITQCAQMKLTAGLVNQPGVLGQHMVVAGNKGFVPASIASTFIEPVRPLAPPMEVAMLTATPSSPTAGNPSSQLSEPARPILTLATASNGIALVPISQATAPVSSPDASHSSVRAAQPGDILAEIHQQRDGARQLQVKLGKARLRIKRDKFELAITPKQDGYLYIALAGSDNKSLYLIYPNELDTDNYVHAGETLNLPKRDWEIKAGGPVGTDTLLVMVADSPRQLDDLKGETAGPFVKTLLDPQGKAQLQWLLSNSATADSTECSSSERLRNLVVTRKCSDAFASALVKIDEVK